MARLSIKFFIVTSVILLPRFAAGSFSKVRSCIYFNISSRETILIFSIHEEHFAEQTIIKTDFYEEGMYLQRNIVIKM